MNSWEGRPREARGLDCPWGILVLWLFTACCTVGPAAQVADPSGDRAALHGTIIELYEAFCFDPLEEPDWETQRRIFLTGASFVPPSRAGAETSAMNTEDFLADFKAYVRSEPYRSSGFHERLIGVHIDLFGGVASAFVSFEGFVPGETLAATRGLDSLQFVKSGGDWRLVSFSTQYEDEDLSIPPPYLRVD